jgi:hypothetical protein
VQAQEGSHRDVAMRPSARLTRVAVPVIAAITMVVMTACTSNRASSSSPEAGASSSAVASPTASGAPVAPIVGRWEQVHTCRNLVHAFKEAGLGALAPFEVAGGGPVEVTRKQLIEKAQKLAQQKDLCAGAWHPYRHYHFFTADGRFGSLDQNLQQVDDGTYKVVGHMLVFGKNKFRYRVIHGDTLTLEPVITPAMRRAALAHPPNDAVAEWMVSVAFTGSTWKRVPCEQWC